MSKTSRFVLTALSVALVSVFVSAVAHASPPSKPDISISSPAIQTLQDRMAARFDDHLRLHFELGSLGFTQDGLIQLHDPDKVSLSQRASLKTLVAEDNRDRLEVYHQVAVANGHPEWESRIKEIFARQWVESAKSGWWYQDASGLWKQK